jgi:hypothetical protein
LGLLRSPAGSENQAEAKIRLLQGQLLVRESTTPPSK